MTQIPELRGAILGKGYRLGQSVGDAQNALFETTHERIPGRFLVKVFAPESLRKPEAAARIQRATRVASLLRDPHTFQILDFAVSGETPAFVVMEGLDGEFLSVALAHTGALPLTRVVDVVDSIGNALSAAHKMGLVHGDLRPDLVVLTNSGTPTAQVAGFGWSKEFRLAATSRETVLYLAPEQRAGSTVAIDERADQFSLAVIAYEMLSSRLPFPEGAGALSAGPEERHVPPRLAGSVEGIPSAIDDVLRRALSFLPGERFSGIRELVSQLRIASVGLPEPLRAVVARPEEDDDRDVFATTGATLPSRESPFDNPTPDPAAVTGAEERVGDTDVSDWNEAAIAESVDDDAALVLGESAEDSASSGDPSAVSEDGKTQITRSPFFEGASDDDEAAASSVDADDEEIEADDEDADGDDRRVTSPSPRPPIARLSGPPKGSQLPRTSPPMGLPAPKGVDVGAGDDSLARVTAPSGTRPPVAIPPKSPFAGLTHDPRVRFGAVAVLMVGLATMALLSRGGAGRSKSTPTQSVSTAPSAAPTVAAIPPAAAPPAIPTPSVPVVEAVPPKVPVLAIQEPAPPSAAEASPEAAAADETAEPAAAPHAASRPRALRPPPVRRAVDRSAAATSPAGETSKAESAGGAGDCQVRIDAHPSAEVWLDGKNTGKHTPLSGYRVSCGTHELTLKRPEQDIEQMEVLKIKRGQPFRGSYELE